MPLAKESAMTDKGILCGYWEKGWQGLSTPQGKLGGPFLGSQGLAWGPRDSRPLLYSSLGKGPHFFSLPYLKCSDTGPKILRNAKHWHDFLRLVSLPSM